MKGKIFIAAWLLAAAMAGSAAAYGELHCAARNGSIEELQAYLVHGKDINVRDESGNTPLLEVSGTIVSPGIPGVVKILLEHGANVNARDKYGRTLLDWAVYHEKTEVVKPLLDNGAKFTREDFEKFAEKHPEKDALYWLLHDASFR